MQFLHAFLIRDLFVTLDLFIEIGQNKAENYKIKI